MAVKLTELRTNVSTSTKLRNAGSSRHAQASLQFPTVLGDDVDASHFIKFNIIRMDGAEFPGTASRSSDVPEETDWGDISNELKALAIGVGVGIVGTPLAGVAAYGATKLAASALEGPSAPIVQERVGVYSTMGETSVLTSGYEDPYARIDARSQLPPDESGLPSDYSWEDLHTPMRGKKEIPADDPSFTHSGTSGIPHTGHPHYLPDENFKFVEDTGIRGWWGRLTGLEPPTMEYIEAMVQGTPAEKDRLNEIRNNAGFSHIDITPARSHKVADIVLYMPHSINESFQAQWGGENLGEFGQPAAELLGKMGTEEGADWSGVWDIFGTDISSRIREGLGNMGAGVLGNKAIAKAQMRRAAGGAGHIKDPHFETFFNGVNPRIFSFDFSLAPRNMEEAEMIRKIIREFKYHSAPTREDDGGQRYWVYPRIFEIEYWNYQKTHKIDKCALQNITVNYSGTGSNHTFEDGTPLQTNLTLSFVELELRTSEDFRELEGNGDSQQGGF